MKRYSEEFKKEAVRLAIEGGMSQSRVARDLGVNINSLISWIRKAKTTRGGEVRETFEQENRRLRRELAIVTEERDIIKKALGIFSKELR
ncbi:MAG: transposase [bacterium]